LVRLAELGAEAAQELPIARRYCGLRLIQPEKIAQTANAFTCEHLDRELIATQEARPNSKAIRRARRSALLRWKKLWQPFASMFHLQCVVEGDVAHRAPEAQANAFACFWGPVFAQQSFDETSARAGPDGLPFLACRVAGNARIKTLYAASMPLFRGSAPPSDFIISHIVSPPKGTHEHDSIETLHSPKDTRPTHLQNTDNNILASSVNYIRSRKM
jgi:hypothetical protein